MSNNIFFPNAEYPLKIVLELLIAKSFRFIHKLNLIVIIHLLAKYISSFEAACNNFLFKSNLAKQQSSILNSRFTREVDLTKEIGIVGNVTSDQSGLKRKSFPHFFDVICERF